MNSARSATVALGAPLQSLLRWLLPTRPVLPVAPRRRGGTVAPAAIPSCHLPPVRRPLRVVRVVEAGQPRSQVGRMVISGRMADVCAELDRLAAGEAA